MKLACADCACLVAQGCGVPSAATTATSAVFHMCRRTAPSCDQCPKSAPHRRRSPRAPSPKQPPSPEVRVAFSQGCASNSDCVVSPRGDLPVEQQGAMAESVVGGPHIQEIGRL